MRDRFGLVLLASITTLGCSDATGALQGGDSIFDAALAPMAEGGGVDAPSGCQAGGANGGSTWADLYTCFFGPTGVANCVTAACHATSGAGSGFWSCTPSLSDCWTGIQKVVAPATQATALYPNLRKSDGTGNMPLTGTNGGAAYVFTSEDLTRINTWIQNGAKGP